MENLKKYYAYRANIAFEDINLFNYDLDDTKEGRNKVFREFFSQLSKDKLKTNYNIREYMLLYVGEKDDIVYCQLARRRNVNINKMEKLKIVGRNEEDYPYVNVIVDLINQKFLVQANSSVFSNYDTAKKVIENIIRFNIKEKNAIITLNPITIEKEFYNYLSESEYIYSIKFKLNAPNFLDGEFSAENFVSAAHEETSADELEITMKNKSGRLDLGKEGVASFVKYAECGAGSWELNYKGKENKRQCVKSGEFGKSVDLDILLSDYLTEMQVRAIKKAFNQVETIEKFKEELNEES